MLETTFENYQHQRGTRMRENRSPYALCASCLSLIVLLIVSDRGLGQHVVDKGADFIVEDMNGDPCVLASLNITVQVKYRTSRSTLVRQINSTLTRHSVQDQSGHYFGHCGRRLSKLSISWLNRTFTLNLTFLLQDELELKGNRNNERRVDMDDIPPGVHSSVTWSLHQVSLTYDTAHHTVFPAALNPSVTSVSTQNLNLFKTPLGLSYICQTPGAVVIQFRDDVDLVFNSVHLLPFGADTTLWMNGTRVTCSQDMDYAVTEDRYPTLFIFSVFCAIIILLATFGYAGARYVTWHCGHSGYRPLAREGPKDEMGFE